MVTQPKYVFAIVRPALRGVPGVSAQILQCRSAGDTRGDVAFGTASFLLSVTLIGDRWGGPPAGRFYAPSR